MHTLFSVGYDVFLLPSNYFIYGNNLFVFVMTVWVFGRKRYLHWVPLQYRIYEIMLMDNAELDLALIRGEKINIYLQQFHLFLIISRPGPEVIKLFSMLHSAEHETYPAHKC